MHVYSFHEKPIRTSTVEAGAVLDGLSWPNDPLWPVDDWPPMRFDAPLGVGARGGHGPVRYTVTEYVPGNRVVFRFDQAGLVPGFSGHHIFELIPDGDNVRFRHVIEAECGFGTWLKWKILVEPLHDALLKDAFNRAERSLGHEPVDRSPWSAWVRFLRWVIARAGGEGS